MFDRKSLYALNKKDPDAIVYSDADGRPVRLTREDFADEESFLRWKEWSDQDFHQEEKEAHRFANHTRTWELHDESSASAPSPDAIFQDKWDQQEKNTLYAALQHGFTACLTDTQRRRLWLHCVEGLTLREIAAAEQTSFQSVARTVAQAKRKLLVFLKNRGDKTCF